MAKSRSSVEKKAFDSIGLREQELPFIDGELEDFNISMHRVYVSLKRKFKNEGETFYQVDARTNSNTKASFLIASRGDRWALYNSLNDMPEFFENDNTESENELF